jgi:RHH-type transcriptional regulator, rel operon repressor / antitoxin RelB
LHALFLLGTAMACNSQTGTTSFMRLVLAIRLPETIEKRLAKANRRTKTYYAREAILRHLDDLEDIYLAEKALHAILSGRSRTIPIEEVMRRRGLKR